MSAFGSSTGGGFAGGSGGFGSGTGGGFGSSTGGGFGSGSGGFGSGSGGFGSGSGGFGSGSGGFGSGSGGFGSGSGGFGSGTGGGFGSKTTGAFGGGTSGSASSPGSREFQIGRSIGDAISGLALSGSGRLLASTSWSCDDALNVYVLDTEWNNPPDLLHQEKKQQDAGTCVVFVDNDRLVYGTSFGEVFLQTPEQKKQDRIFDFPNMVTCMCYDQRRQILVCGCGNSLKMCDLRSLKQEEVSVGKLVLGCDVGWDCVTAIAEDKVVGEVDLRNRKWAPLPVESKQVNGEFSCVTSLPLGGFLVGTTNGAYSWKAPGVERRGPLALWNIKGDVLCATATGRAARYRKLGLVGVGEDVIQVVMDTPDPTKWKRKEVRTGPVTACAFDPSGMIYALGCGVNEGKIRVLNTDATWGAK